MRVLVTGGSGFIGSHLLDGLVQNHETFAVARTTGSPTDGVTWIQADLARPLDHSALPAAIDAVIHLAQSRRYREFPDGAEDIFAVNIASTFSLLEYARVAGARTFLLASTGGVYASSFERLVETDPVSPIDFYRTSKYAAELLTANYERFFRTIVFRLFFVYGAGQHGMLMPTLVEKVARGETITIDGPDGIRINPIYVDDAVAALFAGLELDRSAVFNVAGDETVTLRELVQLMGKVLGRDVRIESRGAAPDGDLVGDNTRLKDELGVRLQVSLREGLRALSEAAVA